MTRYIDGDAVLELIQEEFHKTDVNGAEQIGVLTCHRIVREAPTADVVEVRHGEWIPEMEWFDEEEGISAKAGYYQTGWKCSLCGRKEYEKEPYCNCGAKMDGTPKERGGEK